MQQITEVALFSIFLRVKKKKKASVCFLLAQNLADVNFFFSCGNLSLFLFPFS
jgi:hypothetical protein